MVALLATPAALAAPRSATLTAKSPTTTTVPYGSYWTLTYFSTQDLNYEKIGVEVTGIPGEGDYFGNGYSRNSGEYRFDLSNGQQGRLIDVGTYSVGVNVDAGTRFTATLVRATTTKPHTLIIEPAELSATLQSSPASADPQNTVITMSLGGSWLDDVACCEYRWIDNPIHDISPAPPAGTWNMIIKNAAGDVIIEEQFEQVRGEEPAAVFLWTGSPLAESVTVSSTFTPSGDEGRNFEITQAAPLTFTTGEASRPVIELPVVPDPPAVAVPTGVGVPVWVLTILAVVGFAAGVTAILLAVRGRPALSPSVPADAPDRDGTDMSEARTEVHEPAHRAIGDAAKSTTETKNED